MGTVRMSIALACVLAVAAASSASASPGEGRLACKAWSGIVRSVAASAPKGYPPVAAQAVVRGAERVDPRLHLALTLTLRGIYAGDPGITRLAYDPAGWTDACVEVFAKTGRGM